MALNLMKSFKIGSLCFALHDVLADNDQRITLASYTRVDKSDLQDYPFFWQT